MTIQRMDHVGVVVDDLAAATAFFVELGLELQGESPVQGGPPTAHARPPPRPVELIVRHALVLFYIPELASRCIGSRGSVGIR
jgi:catechol 2,3-dioxygenase-like lactoylglutathione lyase family enzyme